MAFWICPFIYGAVPSQRSASLGRLLLQRTPGKVRRCSGLPGLDDLGRWKHVSLLFLATYSVSRRREERLEVNSGVSLNWVAVSLDM